MAETLKKKPDTIAVFDGKDNKEFPEKPGVLDYVKEGFESSGVRADLNAIRRRRAKLTGQG